MDSSGVILETYNKKVEAEIYVDEYDNGHLQRVQPQNHKKISLVRDGETALASPDASPTGEADRRCRDASSVRRSHQPTAPAIRLDETETFAY